MTKNDDLDFLRSHITILTSKGDTVTRSEPSDAFLRALVAQAGDPAPKATAARVDIRVDLDGETWLTKLWGPGPVPVGAEVLGRVFRGEDRIGGMLFRHPTGLYSDGNAGSLRTLDPFAVNDAIRRAGAEPQA